MFIVSNLSRTLANTKTWQNFKFQLIADGSIPVISNQSYSFPNIFKTLSSYDMKCPLDHSNQLFSYDQLTIKKKFPKLWHSCNLYLRIECKVKGS